MKATAKCMFTKGPLIKMSHLHVEPRDQALQEGLNSQLETSTGQLSDGGGTAAVQRLSSQKYVILSRAPLLWHTRASWL